MADAQRKTFENAENNLELEGFAQIFDSGSAGTGGATADGVTADPYVQGQVDKLLERFRAMLRISEIGALQRRGGFADVQLATLLSEVGELYEPLAESKSIKLVAQIEPVGAIHAEHERRACPSGHAGETYRERVTLLSECARCPQEGK